MSLSITCDRCDVKISHICNPEIKTLLLKLHMWKPHVSPSEALVAALQESDYYSEGDEDAPFFSESFLYNLLGKEDARTLRGTLHSLQKAIGLDQDVLDEELCQLEQDLELTMFHQEKRGGLVNPICRAKDPEEKRALQKKFDTYLAKIDEKEINAAQRRLDMLDRWEKPEERVRKLVLSAVSGVASDDQFMHTLRGLPSENLSEKFRVFLTNHWSDPRLKP